MRSYAIGVYASFELPADDELAAYADYHVEFISSLHAIETCRRVSVLFLRRV